MGRGVEDGVEAEKDRVGGVSQEHMEGAGRGEKGLGREKSQRGREEAKRWRRGQTAPFRASQTYLAVVR